MSINILDLFQGLNAFSMVDGGHAVFRMAMIAVGLGLLYLGYSKILDPLIMLPMGVGRAPQSMRVSCLWVADKPETCSLVH